MNSFQCTDLKAGHIETFSVIVTEEMLEKFLSITADVSPIHIDEEYARRSGFKGRVVYGMMTASFYSTLVGVYLPGETALLQSVNTSFNSPVFVGDVLIISGEVTNVSETYKQIEIAAAITVADKVVSKARIKVGIREQ